MAGCRAPCFSKLQPATLPSPTAAVSVSLPQIKTMKDQIKDMDRDLERFHKQNAALEASIADMRARVQSLQAGVLEQRARLSRRSTRVHKIQHDLHELVQLIQDPRRLKEKLKARGETRGGGACGRRMRG